MAIEAFLSDVHFPIHEPATWKLTLRLLKKINPGIIFLGGDILDGHAVSRYDKDPAYQYSLQDELDVTTENLRLLRQSFPSATIYFKEGNHEQRLKKFLHSRAAELSCLRGLLLENLLGLNDLDIQWIPNEEKFKIGELWHMHGNEVTVGSVYPARNMYLKLGVNVIFGHYHRKSEYLDRSLDGKSHGAWGNSCMETFQPEYTFHNIWTHGFHVIEYSRYGRFRVEPFTFFQQGRMECFVYRGKTLMERLQGSVAPVREHMLSA